jgi:hypothetical protein
LSPDLAGSLSKALFVLEPLGGGSKTEINLQEEGKRTGTLALESGFYLLKVQLENGYQALGKTEAVHIYPNGGFPEWRLSGELSADRTNAGWRGQSGYR